MKCQILFSGKNKKNISKCCLLKILPNCCTVKGKDTRYKLYRSGNDKGNAGVGVFVAEEWIEKVFEVQRVSDRIILVKLIVGQHVVTFLSVYAPQSGLSDEVKDLFFDQLRAVTARIPASEFLIPCGDWNGHVGHAGTGYREVQKRKKIAKLPKLATEICTVSFELCKPVSQCCCVFRIC